MTRKGLVHFIHGKESGPGGRKLVALSEVAGSAGWRTCSLDYSHTTDPAVRLQQLVTACRGERGPLLLVGSSMGGWVAAEAARQLGASGLFLLAPAVHMAGYPSQAPLVPHAHTEIVHGWDDDVIPAMPSGSRARTAARCTWSRGTIGCRHRFPCCASCLPASSGSLHSAQMNGFASMDRWSSFPACESVSCTIRRLKASSDSFRTT